MGAGGGGGGGGGGLLVGNSALITKIDLMFLITDLQVAINLKNRLDFFFIVEIIDFYL